MDLQAFSAEMARHADAKREGVFVVIRILFDSKASSIFLKCGIAVRLPRAP
jgi:hypothetical protein